MDFQRLPARRILHLELRSPRSYCGDMKRLSSFLPVICLLSLAPLARGQDNATAAARQEEIDERFKRLSGQLQGKFTRWQLSTERGSLARVERLKSAEP